MACEQAVEEPWLDAFRRHCDPLADEAGAEIGTAARFRGRLMQSEAFLREFTAY